MAVAVTIAIATKGIERMVAREDSSNNLKLDDPASSDRTTMGPAAALGHSGVIWRSAAHAVVVEHAVNDRCRSTGLNED